MDTNTQSAPVRSVRFGTIAAGGILLATGAAMLLDRSGMLRLHASRLVAPLVLIALGTAIVFDKGGVVASRRASNGGERLRVCHRRRGGYIPGVWLIGVGTWMLVSQTHLFGLTSHTSWPLLIVFAGVMLVIRGTR
jgi:hypothetical protein